jgi:hypothetical protein
MKFLHIKKNCGSFLPSWIWIHWSSWIRILLIPTTAVHKLEVLRVMLSVL